MSTVKEPVYVTEQGLEKMKEELRRRREELRVEIAERLNHAIKMGDLKENADYHAAKEEQGFNEGRILELDAMIRRAEVIEKGGDSVVGMGSHVTIAEDGDEDDAEEYHIVGAQEANPAEGRISNESPIGRALMGAEVGEVITAQTPGGEIRFKVLAVG